jgi:hypothetical protein
MKIIGTGRQTFIVEMTEDELLQLNGFYSRYDGNAPKDLLPGTTLAMSNIFNTAKVVLSTHEEVKEQAKKLRACAEKFASVFEAAHQDKVEKLKQKP